ncbi:uncharacterized protein PHALS_12346 [Plasmopara halstedii]|uniref:Uncharacterized protein n=1 Tax=Plasmopara halstedii TaxID=4781 RepID=A0A0P1ALQ6_PLAHL|nr:uncharacterized protein PHALS_12346 [Plasmopara halstedii]CEG42040.1 hypothetical protein PHALS_12346 [Plasmopara halstedii]|eukprot:XP_024578409.1 hypothetical protein PHALS_12346 [Plasmopara halstedii]
MSRENKFYLIPSAFGSNSDCDHSNPESKDTFPKSAKEQHLNGRKTTRHYKFTYGLDKFGQEYQSDATLH